MKQLSYAWMIVLAAWILVVTGLAYSSTLNLEAVCSLVILTNFNQTAQHHIPENCTLPSNTFTSSTKP
jgi:hypothetical protein